MNQLESIKNSLKEKDWFYDVGTDEYNRPIVYVHSMNLNIFSEINQFCQSLDSKPCIHYAASSFFEDNKYVDYVNKATNTSESYKRSIQDLITELTALSSICGENILCDIFYEIKDGNNAITNLSSKFPEVRESLAELYEEFGFDLIYDQIEG